MEILKETSDQPIVQPTKKPTTALDILLGQEDDLNHQPLDIKGIKLTRQQ
jgi:hypothetical protein